VQLDLRQPYRRRQEILAVVHRQRLGVAIVDHLLEQHGAERLDQCARHLPVDDARIDDAAAIVDHDVAQHLDAASVDVDLDFAGVRAVVVRHRLGHVIAGGFEARRRALGQRKTRRRLQRARDLAIGQRARGIAAVREHAGLDLDILRRAVKNRGGRRDRLVADLGRRLVDSRPADRGLAAGERAQPERRGSRIACDDADAGERGV